MKQTKIKNNILKHLNPLAPSWKAYAELQQRNKLNADRILEKAHRETFSSAGFFPVPDPAGLSEEALFAALDELIESGQISKLQAVAVLIEYSVEAADKQNIRITHEAAQTLGELYAIDGKYATAPEGCDELVCQWYAERGEKLLAFCDTAS